MDAFYSEQTRQRLVLVIKGHPGTGKKEECARFAKKHDLRIINVSCPLLVPDEISKYLVQLTTRTLISRKLLFVFDGADTCVPNFTGWKRPDRHHPVVFVIDTSCSHLFFHSFPTITTKPLNERAARSFLLRERLPVSLLDGNIGRLRQRAKEYKRFQTVSSIDTTIDFLGGLRNIASVPTTFLDEHGPSHLMNILQYNSEDKCHFSDLDMLPRQKDTCLLAPKLGKIQIVFPPKFTKVQSIAKFVNEHFYVPTRQDMLDRLEFCCTMPSVPTPKRKRKKPTLDPAFFKKQETKNTQSSIQSFFKPKLTQLT
jgi:hypothetical protein